MSIINIITVHIHISSITVIKSVQVHLLITSNKSIPLIGK